jgi:hypothetical protein
MKKIIIYIAVSVFGLLALVSSVTRPSQNQAVLNTSIDTPNGQVSDGIDPRAVDSLTSKTQTDVQTSTNQPTASPIPTATVQPKPTQTSGTYTNSAGVTVKSPVVAPSAPEGASAKCKDGTYSFSQSRRGTCSHHGGVALWL